MYQRSVSSCTRCTRSNALPLICYWKDVIYGWSLILNTNYLVLDLSGKMESKRQQIKSTFTNFSQTASLRTARNYLFTLPFKASVRKNSVFKFFIIKSTYVHNKKRQNQKVKVLPEFIGLKVQEI